MNIMKLPGNSYWSDRRQPKVKSRMREDFLPVLLFQPPVTVSVTVPNCKAPHDVSELTKPKPDIADRRPYDSPEAALCAWICRGHVLQDQDLHA